MCAVERWARSRTNITIQEPVESGVTLFEKKEAAGQRESPCPERLLVSHYDSRFFPLVSEEGKSLPELNTPDVSLNLDTGVWLDTRDLLTAAHRIVQSR